MVHVRIVDMRVDQRRMHVGVGMGLAAVPSVMGMLMVFVVQMGMVVLQVLMYMLMCVTFADM
jgi:hypothetical protein